MIKGYYGKGIYLTQEPNYGEYYTEVVKEKTGDGVFLLLLCWVLIGRPRAITKVREFCFELKILIVSLLN